MARKARIQFEGAVYHVLERGDRREAIRVSRCVQFASPELTRSLEERLAK